MAGRPKTFKNSIVISTRLSFDQHQQLKDIASIESTHTKRPVTVQDLIRNAIKFVYEDNERLRECFRRSRAHINRRNKRN
jgi:hypothetical protein